MATQEDSCGKVLPLRPATGYGGALPGMRHPGQFETTWSRRAIKSMWPLRQIGALPPNMSEGFLIPAHRGVGARVEERLRSAACPAFVVSLRITSMREVSGAAEPTRAFPVPVARRTRLMRGGGTFRDALGAHSPVEAPAMVLDTVKTSR